MDSTNIMTFASLGFSSRALPSHRAISECARAIWRKRNHPTGSDLAIWLLAERRLTAANGRPAARELDYDRGARGAHRHRSATSL